MKFRLAQALPAALLLQLKRLKRHLDTRSVVAEAQRLRRVETDTGYSLLPFDETRSIFVHIPKCAGVSITRALYGNLAGGHSSLKHYLKVFSPEEVDAYFKFTIVRNPWDRLVSAYSFLISGGFGEGDQQFASAELAQYSSFDDFVMHWVSPENVWKRHHFRPQYNYFLDPEEKVSLDFIGRFERLDEDFQYICERLKIDASLPSTNASRHRDYREYYTDKARKIVAEVYARDIELLGYNFDGAF